MKWKKYTIHTTVLAEDIISAMLDELGVEGVQIEDNVPLSESDTKGMFIDLLPELPPDDGTSKVSFFLREAERESESAVPPAEKTAEGLMHGEEHGEENLCSDPADDAHMGGKNMGKISSEIENKNSVDNSYAANDKIWRKDEIEELLANIRAELSDMSAYVDIGEGRIEIGETQDTDWMNNWKQYFKPFLVEDMLIKPTWEEVPAELREAVGRGAVKLLEIDPGTAFGTGSHETTQLCMKMLKKYIKGGEAVLDIGTGSGILGIAALKLGADSVAATDLDEVCREAVSENLSVNGISEDSFRLFIGNLLADRELGDAVGYGCYDIVAANILAPVIIMLAAPGAADRHIKQGGIFITSGIINTKEAEVLTAFSENPAWKILEINHQGEWVNITARRV